MHVLILIYDRQSCRGEWTHFFPRGQKDTNTVVTLLVSVSKASTIFERKYPKKIIAELGNCELFSLKA